MLLGGEGEKKGMCYVAFSFNVLQFLIGGDVIYNKSSLRIIKDMRDRQARLQ